MPVEPATSAAPATAIIPRPIQFFVVSRIFLFSIVPPIRYDLITSLLYYHSAAARTTLFSRFSPRRDTVLCTEKYAGSRFAVPCSFLVCRILMILAGNWKGIAKGADRIPAIRAFVILCHPLPAPISAYSAQSHRTVTRDWPPRVQVNSVSAQSPVSISRMSVGAKTWVSATS